MSLDFCITQTRSYDYDRYLATLFMPHDVQNLAFVLLAFNVEISRIRETVSEPMLGQIRLQWWREALDGIYDGTVRNHAVVEALAEQIKMHDLPREPFDRLIDAREFDLIPDVPDSLDALERYAEDTSSSLFYLLIMPGSSTDNLHKAAKHIGIAWALTGLLRAIPYHKQLGKVFVPESMRVDVLQRIGWHLEQAKLSCLPKQACKLFRLGGLARLYQQRIAADRPTPSPLAKFWALWRG